MAAVRVRMDEPMSKPIDEQISAFLDDELPAAEFDLLLKQIVREPSHRDRFARYALIGECLRDSARRPVVSRGFAERVSAAIAADQPARPVAVARPAWQRRIWMAGAAAALAGIVAVFVATPFATRSEAPMVAASDDAAVGDAAVSTVSATATRRLNPRAAERLTGYLVAHGAYANELSRSNIDSHLVAARAERASWSLPQTNSVAR